MSDTLRQMMGLPPLNRRPEPPNPAHRRPGTDFATLRDAKLKAARDARFTGKPPVHVTMPDDPPRQLEPIGHRSHKRGLTMAAGIAITQCPPAVAFGAYDASRCGRAFARSKANAKRK